MIKKKRSLIYFILILILEPINLSSVGAAGPILGDAVKRISSALDADGIASMDKYEATIRRSFVLSSDQAHALVSVFF